MPLTQQQLSDPEILSAVSRLELHAREVMEGVISGMHQSPYHGFSVEFAQHREYTPGDEIRTIDWKVVARSDRYYVKEFEEETNLKAYLLLDTSESMRYQGVKRKYSKYDFACLIASAFAALLVQQRDAVGLGLFNDGVQKIIPPRGTASHYTQLLEEMVTAQSAPKTGLGATFHHMAEELKRRGFVVILSDLFGDAREVLEGIRHFRYRKHEVLVLHVLDPDEINFPFDDLTKFEGLELEPEILVDPRGIRQEYLSQFNAFCQELEKGCAEMQVDLMRMTTDASPTDLLSRYLAGRMRK